jgi:ubiquinone/menaquinone biosynthesis C-methylase UbiE
VKCDGDGVRLGTYHRLKLLKDDLSRLKSKTVLDVGCNYALIVEKLSNENMAVGLDEDRDALKAAKERDSSLNLVAVDAKNIPISNDSIDYVFCLSVIEHIKDDKRVVSEISRVLKPNGVLILTAPHANFKLLTRPVKFASKLINSIFKTSFPTTDEEYVHFGHEGPGHVRTGYSKSSIRKLLEECDLEMTYYGTYWHLPTRLAYPPLMFLLRVKIISQWLAYRLFDVAIYMDRWLEDEHGDIFIKAEKRSNNQHG